eukprot:14496299-Heterocapsa_arctica.AAC.1
MTLGASTEPLGARNSQRRALTKGHSGRTQSALPARGATQKAAGPSLDSSLSLNGCERRLRRGGEYRLGQA